MRQSIQRWAALTLVILSFRAGAQDHPFSREGMEALNFQGNRCTGGYGTPSMKCDLYGKQPLKFDALVALYAGYRGAQARVKRELDWHIAARPSDMARLDGRSGKRVSRREHAKASVRAKVEHPFRVIKRQFGLTKLRFKGLVKNTQHVITLFALANLWMARKRLMQLEGQVRLQMA